MEFAQHGYEAATVRSICRRAGVNLAAVNYHFGDKQQLYHQAVMEAHRNGVEEIPDQEWTHGSAEERLERFISHFFLRVLSIDQQPSWHHELMLREILKPTQACSVLVDSSIRPRFRRLQAIVQELVPGVEQQRLDALCFSVIGQCLFYKTGRAVTSQLLGRERMKTFTRDYLAKHITRFTLAVLRQEASEILVAEAAREVVA